MNVIFKRSAATVALITALYIVLPPSISMAATHVDLGNASSFGVLAPTITNTGSTVISGTAGSSYGGFGGPTPTGFPPGVAGALHNNDALANLALTDAGHAVTVAGSQLAVSHVLVPNEILTPGAYAIGTLAHLSGSLTLDGGGDRNAVFVFTAPDSLTTASASIIHLMGSAQACNVFWSIGSSATLGTGSTFVGHMVAQASITATNGVSIAGSLDALTGAVTLDTNTVTNDNCAAAVVIPPVVIPPVVISPVQGSRIDSVTPAACVTNGPTTVTLNGLFTTAVLNVTVNGTSIAASSWKQTATTVTVTTLTPTNGPTVIQLYNGSLPLLAVQTFICTPVPVVPVIPVVIPPVVPTVVTGTIHVIKVVNNTYGGAATPGDFTLTLKHWGVNVVGSPAVGVADPGRTYILAPGTYVLGEGDSAAFPNYIHSFDIVGQTTQNVVLHAGENLTIVQTNSELPPLTAPVTPVTPVTPPPPTVTGGVLPKTATPWFNLLLFGFGAMLVGGVTLGLKKNSKI